MFSLWPPLMMDKQKSDMANLEAEEVAVLFNGNIQKTKYTDESPNERQSRVYRIFNKWIPTVWPLPQPQPDSGSWSEGQEWRQGWLHSHATQPNNGSRPEGEE